MTVQSMTGFGKAEVFEENYSATIELKSVNNRFLEFQTRSSRSIQELEPKFKHILGLFMSRGSISCHIQYESKESKNSVLVLNEPVFNSYLALISEAKNRLGENAVVNVSDLLKIPDILKSTETTESIDVTSERLLPLFEKACQDLFSMREREGLTLAKDIETRIQAFFPGLEKVKILVPLRQKEYVQKMRTRVKEIMDGALLSEDRILTEIGLMAERLDITEEIVRLESHLHHFLETMAHHKSPGKKLGFLLQEMLREVNTLGTKSQFPDMQHLCVSWKEELEIIREQIQNIE